MRAKAGLKAPRTEGNSLRFTFPRSSARTSVLNHPLRLVELATADAVRSLALALENEPANSRIGYFVALRT